MAGTRAGAVEVQKRIKPGRYDGAIRCGDIVREVHKPALGDRSLFWFVWERKPGGIRLRKDFDSKAEYVTIPEEELRVQWRFEKINPVGSVV